MDKNDKKLNLVKELGIENSKHKVLEKQLQLSAKVLKRADKELNLIFSDLGIDINEHSKNESNGIFFYFICMLDSQRI